MVRNFTIRNKGRCVNSNKMIKMMMMTTTMCFVYQRFRSLGPEEITPCLKIALVWWPDCLLNKGSTGNTEIAMQNFGIPCYFIFSKQSGH